MVSRNLAVISESRLDEFMRAELSIFAARHEASVVIADTCRDALPICDMSLLRVLIDILEIERSDDSDRIKKSSVQKRETML